MPNPPAPRPLGASSKLVSRIDHLENLFKRCPESLSEDQLSDKTTRISLLKYLRMHPDLCEEFKEHIGRVYTTEIKELAQEELGDSSVPLKIVVCETLGLEIQGLAAGRYVLDRDVTRNEGVLLSAAPAEDVSWYDSYSEIYGSSVAS